MCVKIAGRRKYGSYLELLFGKEPDLSHALCSRCQFPWKSWSCYHPLNRHSGAQSSSCTRTTPHDCFQAYNLDPFLSYTSNRGIINYLSVTCKLYLNIFKQTLLFKGTRVSFWMEIDFWHQYTITILLLQLVLRISVVADAIHIAFNPHQDHWFYVSQLTKEEINNKKSLFKT